MSDSSNGSVAVIGCGYWGKNLVRNFAQLDSLKIVCETSPAARAAASDIAPGTTLVEDYDAVLDSTVQGIVIATPAITHHALAKRALEAGKDVFVEKPLALSFEDGAELVRIAAERNRVLMVGHVLQYHPAIDQMRDLIHSGEIGEIRYLYSNRLSLGKVRREENILWSFAPHDIAVMLDLVRKLPVQVTASGGNYLRPGIADVTVTNLLFDDGVRAHIFVSWLHPFKEQRLVVIGSKKMLSFDDVGKHLIVYDQRVDIENGEPIPVRGAGQEINFPGDEPLRMECQAFLDAMTSRTPPRSDGKNGLQVLSVLQAASQSLTNNGLPVSLQVEA